MKKALIIDDSAFMRQVVKKTVANSGFEVDEAENGQEALNLLQESLAYTLVISDVNMPVMDGLTMLQNAQTLDGFRQIPVIMLTTESLDEMKARGQELGVAEWLVKPFQPDELMQAIQRVTSQAS